MIQGPSGSWCRELTYSNGTDATLAEDALEDIPYDFCITRVEN